MRLFLDTSVLLAACGSATGASREIILLAPFNRWRLISSPYVVEETLRNLPKVGPNAIQEWRLINPFLEWAADKFTLDRPVVFPPAKDRPVLFTALAWADILLTLDDAHFGSLLGRSFYELIILAPGDFLYQQRQTGSLR